MATVERMSWLATQKRWQRKYRGRTYRVSPRQLGCPATRSGSRDAANQWWERTEADADAAIRGQHASKFDEIVQALRASLDSLAAQPNDAPLDGTAATHFRLLRAMLDATVEAKAGGKEIPPADKPPLRLALKPFADEPWREPAKPTGDAIEEYLRLRELDVKNGDLTAGRFSPLSGHLRYFGRWLADQRRTVETLDGGTWDAWGRHCRELVANQSSSASYARDRFRAGKQLVKWAAAVGRLGTLPLNLDAVKPKQVQTGDVATIPLDALRGILDAAPERLRFWMLLALNIGGTQQDLADLRVDEFDGKAITRARSKTRKHGIEPRRYPLWSDVLAGIEKFKAASGDLLLTNADGRALVQSAIVDGKLQKSDAIKSAYYRLGVKLKRELPPLKLLRSTGSTLIAEVADKDVAEWYLCHAGKSIADQHYIKISNERLAAALSALGDKLLPPQARVEGAEN